MPSFFMIMFCIQYSLRRAANIRHGINSIVPQHIKRSSFGDGLAVTKCEKSTRVTVKANKAKWHVYTRMCPRPCVPINIRRVQLKRDGTRRRTGGEVRGKLVNGVGSQSPTHRFTLPRNLVYPALLPLMRTPRLPAVDWTDAPADLNGLVRFAERPNLVSARVLSHFKRTLHKQTYVCVSPYIYILLVQINRYNFAAYRPLLLADRLVSVWGGDSWWMYI